MTSTTETVALDDVGPVEISLEDAGAGQTFFLLHGGGGPDTMTRFGQRFAQSQPARVLVPTTLASLAPPDRSSSTPFAVWQCSTLRYSTTSA